MYSSDRAELLITPAGATSPPHPPETKVPYVSMVSTNAFFAMIGWGGDQPLLCASYVCVRLRHYARPATEYSAIIEAEMPISLDSLPFTSSMVERPSDLAGDFQR